MESLQTVALILLPMFIGFAIRLPKPYLRFADRLLNALVYVILLLIGMGLAHMGGLLRQLGNIALYTSVLSILLILCNLSALMLLDKLLPWQGKIVQESECASHSFGGSLGQIIVVGLGILLGLWLPESILPSERAATAALMLLVFVVGLQLRGNGIPLKTVLLNTRGMQICIVFVFSSLLAGMLFAACFNDVSWSKGLALSSGYGWYSLSGIMMTKAYGADWGSVALFNDLLREFFALTFVPVLMRRSSAAAVGIGGATSLDFTLPLIRRSGGLAAVTVAISFGFITNLLAPLLMLVFSAFK